VHKALWYRAQRATSTAGHAPSCMTADSTNAEGCAFVALPGTCSCHCMHTWRPMHVHLLKVSSCCLRRTATRGPVALARWLGRAPAVVARCTSVVLWSTPAVSAASLLIAGRTHSTQGLRCRRRWRGSAARSLRPPVGQPAIVSCSVACTVAQSDAMLARARKSAGQQQ
jgi:hypothetical protein